jgi:hypothetical protein
MARQLALALVLALAPAQSLQLLLGVFCVLLLCLLPHVFIQPYALRSDNILETVCLGETLLTFLVPIIGSIPVINLGPGSTAFISACHIFTAIGILVFWSRHFIFRFVRWLSGGCG